jgi:hypothetical protein
VQLAVSAKFGAIFNAKVPGKFCVRTFTPREFPNPNVLSFSQFTVQLKLHYLLLILSLLLLINQKRIIIPLLYTA